MSDRKTLLQECKEEVSTSLIKRAKQRIIEEMAKGERSEYFGEIFEPIRDFLEDQGFDVHDEYPGFRIYWD